MKRLLARAATMICASFLALPAFAGDLTGTVHDAQAQPVAGVRVAVPALGLETVTDAAGAFAFRDMPEGETRLTVQLGDGAVQHVAAPVPKNGTAKRDIFLLSISALADAQANLATADAAEAEALADEAWLAARKQLAEARGAEPARWIWRDDEA